MKLISLIGIAFVIVPLFLLTLILILIVKRKFKKVIVLLLPFIISLFCWVFVRDRSRIVGNYSLFRHQLPISQAFHAYRHIHNRFPLNIYEIIDDRIYWEFLVCIIVNPGDQEMQKIYVMLLKRHSPSL